MREHARRRISERYGLPVTDDDVLQIEAIIRRGRALKVIAQYWAQSVQFVVYQDVPVFVVYDEALRCLVTALPKDHEIVLKFKKKNHMI